jgi:hypothetical protein
VLKAPSVSILIPTYARAKILRESLYSAVTQKYRGEFEIVLLNDNRRQTLEVNDPRVRVINTDVLYNSLGEKRQAMLGMAKNEWVAFLDDDDLWMPWHLDKVLSGVDKQAIFPIHQYKHFLHTWTWEVIPGGLCMFARTDVARRAGFPPINLGEDNGFRNAVRDIAGIHVAAPGGPSQIYRPMAPVMHISKAMRGGECIRSIFLDSAEKKMDLGIEPTGRVVIEPAYEMDYLQLIRDRFLDTVPKEFL